MIEVPDQFESLEVGVLIHDPQTGSVLYANQYAEELYGYSSRELKEMDVGEFSSTSFSQEEAIQRIQAAAAGNSQQFEWRNKRSTGELYWVEVRLSDITINGDQYVVALVRDITEHKIHLRHLRVLTRITRHNLRNKLNVINGFLEEFDADHSNNDLFIRVKRNVSDLLDLTDWINTVKSATKIKKPSTPQDISKTVIEVGERYQEKYHRITWEFECEPVYVSADPKMKMAIEELIDNAITHNPHDNLKITISVEKCQDDGQAVIRIHDTGPPIPDIEIEPIVGGYDPEPLEHGEGIGLWEVQTIIQAHGGRLSIPENSLDRKVIEIALPQAQAKATHP